MIRIDAIWLATEPMDMRAGTETALARVITVFGAAKPHCAYLFANRREQSRPDQASLLDDLIDTDIAAIEAELEALGLLAPPHWAHPSFKEAPCCLRSLSLPESINPEG